MKPPDLIAEGRRLLQEALKPGRPVSYEPTAGQFKLLAWVEGNLPALLYRLEALQEEVWDARDRMHEFGRKAEALERREKALEGALRDARHELYDVQDATTPARRARIGDALTRIDAALAAKEPTP